MKQLEKLANWLLLKGFVKFCFAALRVYDSELWPRNFVR